MRRIFALAMLLVIGSLLGCGGRGDDSLPECHAHRVTIFGL